jgi:hypothetical protein
MLGLSAVAAQARDTGVVSLITVTTGPLCDKFTLNGATWGVDVSDKNAGQRLSLVEIRAALGLPITVSLPSDIDVHQAGASGPDKIPCGVAADSQLVEFPNAALIQ